MNDSPGLRPAAFFDLDLTLISVNSGRLWLQRERRMGRLTSAQLLRAMLYLGLYHFGMVDIERAFDHALRTIRGVREEEVRTWTREWFRAEVAPRAAPGAWSVIAHHRAAGHFLALLTSSSLYESEAAVELFGLHTFRCTRYEVVDGRFTGRCVRPLCYGPGKVVHAEQLAAEHGLDLAASSFYTDSITDLPLLERVGHPRVVHPDPRLRRLARRRGWSVLDWARP